MADPNPLAGMPLAESLANNMNESLQWMSRMWGNAAAAPLAGAGSPLPSGLPSMMVPTLDPKELEKRISDLRSVLHWLDMNRALLQTTIQTLEMQRDAIVALQSMAMSGQTGAAAASRSADPPPAQVAAPGPAEGAPGAPSLPFNPAQWWNALGEQFARVASAAMADSAAAGPDRRPDPDAPPASGPDAVQPRSAASTPAAGTKPGRKGPGQ
jgi:hypothetical protein